MKRDRSLRLHRHNASHVPFTGFIDHETFVMLLNDQGCDELRQLARFQEVRGVAGTASATPRDDVEVPARERLVQKDSAGLEQVGKTLESRTIEEADHDKGVEGFAAKRQRPDVGDDTQNSPTALDSRDDGALDEVGDDRGAPGSRDSCGVTAAASRNVEHHGGWRQREATLDDPAGWSASELMPTFHVPGLPVGAMATGLVGVVHR